MSNRKPPLNNSLLPRDTGQALQFLMRISQGLLDLSERETQAIVMNDMFTFSILQDEKEILAERYAKASAEFRDRIQEFKNADRNHIARLETLQKNLGEKTNCNSLLVSEIRKRAEQNAHRTLLSVQELGQMKPVSFANNNAQQERI